MTQAIDQRILRQLRVILGDEADEVVRNFIQAMPAQLATMAEAARRDDQAMLIQLAHNLKSTSANLGFIELAESFTTIENGLRQHTLSNPQAAVEFAEQRYAHLQQLL